MKVWTLLLNTLAGQSLIYINFVTPGDCSYVTCEPGPWSFWSAQCGQAERKRDIKTVKKTVQKMSCKGLQQTCPKDEESEQRMTLCKFGDIFPYDWNLHRYYCFLSLEFVKFHTCIFILKL